MEIISAEQAVENAKGLTFEKVWVALMESKKQMQESHEKTEKVIADLSKNIGGLGNSLGRLVETMFSADLLDKFNELGYPFTRQTAHTKYTENKEVIAEVDVILENGEFAMLVEIKTELSVSDVDEHLTRIGKIREYMDRHNDNRKLLGAVAGGIASENVIQYAHKKGLFVVIQTGDSTEIAKRSDSFAAKSW